MADTDIVCISPIDGRELVRRPIMSETAIDAAVKAAREAQKAWRNTSIAERAAKVSAFLDALLAMNQEVVPEIAQQMGRPVRYGGEFRGVEERARYMISHCGEEPAADPGRRREAGLPPHDQARAGRPRARHRALELSLSHRHQHHRAGAHGRQCGAAEARVADGAGRRALPDGDGPGRHAEGPVPEPASQPRPDGPHSRQRPRRSLQLHRLRLRRALHRARSGGLLHLARARARRQGPGLCARGRQSRSRHREPRRRRLLQFGPVLLRHRAHLCAREALRPLRRGRGQSREHLCARQSARRGDDARPDGAQALRRSRAPAERGSGGEGREGAYRRRSVSRRIRAAPPISRRRC